MSLRYVNDLALLLLKRIATDEGLRSSNEADSHMYKRETQAVILVGNLLLSTPFVITAQSATAAVADAMYAYLSC
ncbi:TPA: hypothetical protein ACH3X3_000963 [Trebouxia sp. C0006]